MMRSSGPADKIEAEMALDIGGVQLVRRFWNEPINIRSDTADSHHLELSLLPRNEGAQGCFPDFWGPHRFEPIGEMFFMPAGHAIHAKSNCRHQNSIILNLRPEALDQWLEGGLQWSDSRLQASLDIASADIRRLMFRMGEELRNPGFASKAIIELMAAQVAIELSRYFMGIDESKAAGGLSPWHLKLIDERLADGGAAPSLAELARLCNLSVRHLTRAFRVSRGRSISVYVGEHRMDEAKRLLASGMGVKSVAYAMGFTAPSNFAAAFRRATGEAPRQYRQRASRSSANAPEIGAEIH